MAKKRKEFVDPIVDLTEEFYESVAVHVGRKAVKAKAKSEPAILRRPPASEPGPGETAEALSTDFSSQDDNQPAKP